jgi:penicillin-binding protein 1A
MMRNWWKTLLIVTIIILVLPVLFVISVNRGAFGHLQTENELLSYKNATATKVLSAEGELIGNFFSENRTNISYGQIPQDLINALIATEDSRFFEHKGIDSRSLLRVLFKSILLNKRESGGGSTISQQLAKNMFGRKNNGPLYMLIIKTKEAILAHRLEKTFSKEEILTLYLNTVSFGENNYGIETASRRYFNKRVELLNLEESALLVGMLKGSTLYNPRLHPENSVTRRNVVLRQMQKYNYITESHKDSLSKLPLVQNFADIESEGPADYFLVIARDEAEKILQNVQSKTGKKWNLEEDGLLITTTLNFTLQKYALESFREHLSVMQQRLWEQYQTPSGRKQVAAIAGEDNDSLKQALLVLHAGLLAMDPFTGSVRAWVGGIDFQTQPYDQIYARRQMASVFKPILYAEAFEEGMDPCQYLENDSIVPSTPDGWSPANFDHSTGGFYSLSGALALSMNIPTYNLFLNVGFARLDSLWQSMGFSYKLDNTPSLALGTAEGSIMETALAYSAFANGGYRITPQNIISIKTHDGEMIWQNDFIGVKKRVLTERTAILISEILQKAVREGTGSSMSSVFGIRFPMAGKTGTSQDYSDAWFAAFNPKLTIVSRVGASSRFIHFYNGTNGSGSALALPLVALTLKKMQDNDTLKAQYFAHFPGLPPELVGALDCPDFKEKNLLGKFLDLFQKKRKFPDENLDPAKQKKKGFLKRIFGK